MVTIEPDVPTVAKQPAPVDAPEAYRQGDVLLVRERDGFSLPESVRLVERDDAGRIVLAFGEATGHAHAVVDPDANLFEAQLGFRYLVVGGDGVDLLHEEHAPIRLRPGCYRVHRQREYRYTAWGQATGESQWISD